ncbi:uncharacterized protein TNCV_2974871 [Trichonephila clavipes]|nr:uncharacterized protein TNCV_2974871 [Trichonephila clavipes]
MQLSCSVVQDMAEIKMPSPVASSPSPPISGHFDDMEELSHSPSPPFRGPNEHLPPSRVPEKYFASNTSKSCISFSVDYLLADKNRTFRGRTPSPPPRRQIEQLHLPKRFTVDGILDTEDNKRLPVTGTVCPGLGSRPITLQSQAATVPIAAPCWAHPLGSAFPWLQASRSISPPNSISYRRIYLKPNASIQTNEQVTLSLLQRSLYLYSVYPSGRNFNDVVDTRLSSDTLKPQ